MGRIADLLRSADTEQEETTPPARGGRVSRLLRGESADLPTPETPTPVELGGIERQRQSALAQLPQGFQDEPRAAQFLAQQVDVPSRPLQTPRRDFVAVQTPRRERQGLPPLVGPRSEVGAEAALRDIGQVLETVNTPFRFATEVLRTPNDPNLARERGNQIVEAQAQTDQPLTLQDRIAIVLERSRTERLAGQEDEGGDTFDVVLPSSGQTVTLTRAQERFRGEKGAASLFVDLVTPATPLEAGFARGLGVAARAGAGQVASSSAKLAPVAARLRNVRIPQGAASIITPGKAQREIFGFAPITSGLTRTQRLLNVGRRALDRVEVLDNELATPAVMERARITQRVTSVGRRTGAVVADLVNRAFPEAQNERVVALIGVDQTLPGAPRIQDIAARLPRYWDALTPEQQQAMTRLRELAQGFRNVLDESGIELGQRSDIIDGGFYLPRGVAESLDGLDTPIIPSSRSGGKKGFERTARFDSMAQGIEEGFEYPSLNEVMQNYALQSGVRSRDAYLANYFKNLTDETGKRIGTTAADRVSDDLRNQITKLRNQIRQKRQTIRNTLLRYEVRSQEARRSGKTAERQMNRAAARRIRAVQAAANFDAGDIKAIRRDIRQSISEGRSLAQRIGEIQGRIAGTRSGLSKADREIVSATTKLENLVAEADQLAKGFTGQNLSQEQFASRYGSLLRKADTLREAVADLEFKADALQSKYDDLVLRGEIFSDMSKVAREELVAAQRTERAHMAHERTIRVLESEANLLNREAARGQKIADAAGNRRDREILQAVLKGEEFDDLRETFRQVDYRWKRALKIAQETPPGQTGIDISGLQGYSFPNEIANAINKQLRREGALRGSRSEILDLLNNLNSNYRALRATADNSVIGIQGLLFASDNAQRLRTNARIIRLNMQTWMGRDSGPQVLGAYINDFDDAARAQGRFTSAQWATRNLAITGEDTEYAFRAGFLNKAVGRVPGAKVVKAVAQRSNRTFGYTGDAMRLSWADSMLGDELKKGRTLEQIINSGDIDRIANIANNMTGYSNTKAFGSYGDLLLFAPRFLQSRLTTVANAGLGLRPGASLDQRLARRSMLKMIAYGSTLTMAVNYALGNDTDLQPIKDGRWNPNFMRIRFADRDWSVFGPWDSLARAISLTAQGKPQDALRGMSSGIVGMSWDFLSGENFVGRKVRETPGDFAAWIFESLSPFSFTDVPNIVSEGQKAIDEEGLPAAFGAAFTIGGELVGAKSSPLSFADLRNEASRELYGLPYSDLNKGQQRQVNLWPKVAERLREFGEDEDLGSERQQVSGAFNDYERTSQTLADQAALRLRGLNGGPAQTELLQDLLRDRAIAAQTVFDNPAVQTALESTNQPIEDVLAERFWSAQPQINLDTGQMMFDAFREERARILDEAIALGIDPDYITGEGAGSYRSNRFPDHPELQRAVQEMEADFDALEPYFEAGDLFASLDPVLEAKWDRYQRSDTITRSLMRKTDPELEDMARFQRAAREQMKQDPRVDVALVRRYGSKPVTIEGLEVYAKLYIEPFVESNQGLGIDIGAQ